MRGQPGIRGCFLRTVSYLNHVKEPVTRGHLSCRDTFSWIVMSLEDRFFWSRNSSMIRNHLQAYIFRIDIVLLRMISLLLVDVIICVNIIIYARRIPRSLLVVIMYITIWFMRVYNIYSYIPVPPRRTPLVPAPRLSVHAVGSARPLYWGDLLSPLASTPPGGTPRSANLSRNSPRSPHESVRVSTTWSMKSRPRSARLCGSRPSASSSRPR